MNAKTNKEARERKFCTACKYIDIDSICTYCHSKSHFVPNPKIKDE
jgi:recombinational DNA repair protein RecR